VGRLCVRGLLLGCNLGTVVSHDTADRGACKRMASADEMAGYASHGGTLDAALGEHG